MSNRSRAATTLLTVALCFLTLAHNGRAEPPTWGQCSCPATKRPSADDAKYSVIKNASLCVAVARPQPICSITVHCLSDGTGPNCGDRAGSDWKLANMRTAIDRLTRNTRTIADAEARDVLLTILKETFGDKEHKERWGKCYDNFVSSKQTAGEAWDMKDGVTCINTASGWMHVVISAPPRKPFPGRITRISYQFSPAPR